MDTPQNELHEGLSSLLEHMGKIEATDLYLVAGHPAVFRIDDASYPARTLLEPDDVASMADSLMTATQRFEFRSTFEMSVVFAGGVDERFRASLFFQRGTQAIVVRRVSTRIKTLQELGHGPELEKLALTSRGLVLVVGDKRSGRSTTLAALIDHRNTTMPGHILTIEEPIDRVHPHKQCVVVQREVGVDTCSYVDALRTAVGQAPDLIFIGEIRDADTMEKVLALSEGGQACFSTLHASHASQAIERAVSFFPEARHAEIRMRLSRALRAVIAQRLVRALPEGRVAAVELLLDTPQVRELIRRGESAALDRALERATDGCCSFDSALLALFSVGRIAAGEALKAADRPPELLACIQRVQEAEESNRVVLRMESEPHDAPAPVAAPSADRRIKTGPVR